MSIWNTLKTHAKAQFLDVIQWMEDDRNTIVYRFPVFNQAIQDGGKLVVREGQSAIFVNEGQLSEVFGPGTYELSSRTKAIASFFESIKYGLNYPYKGDIFFVSTRRFTDQKWGTPNPIMLSDKQLGPVRIRAFGIFSYRVKDAAGLLRELVGNQGLFTTEEINGQLKRKLVSAFADTVGEAKMPVLDLAAQYMDIGEALRDKISPKFEADYGIQLTDFVVENISLPPEVEKMLDKRTSMGLLGDMGQYTAFQAANAIEANAAKPGAANPMMDAGMGLAMGGLVGQQLGRALGPQGPGYAAPPAYPAVPPPPPMAEVRYHYQGPDGQAQLSAAEVAARVAANRSAPIHVWAPGFAAWKPWAEVGEIVALVPPAAPPPPPAPPAGEPFHFHAPDGQGQAPAAEIKRRLDANPGARILVWKTGFADWKDAREVPEILSAGGPPPIPGGPPAPPPFPR
jgi:membrane protease subunit (stomatin/prohibitin family)